MASDGANRPKAEVGSEAYTATRARMVDGVRKGDILMPAGWYFNSGSKDVVSIYQDAKQREAKP